MTLFPPPPALSTTTLLALCVGLPILTNPAAAEELKFDFSGSASAFTKATHIGATDLVPDPASQNYADKRSGVDLVLRPELTFGILKFAAQLRLTTETDQDPDAVLDEAYLEVAATDQLFFAIGRRNLTYGQAYGLNPSDVFRVPLAENRIFPSEKSRRDVEGIDVVSADLLFDNSASVQVIYAPKEPAGDGAKPFLMLRYSAVAADGALDYGLSAFGGSRPGIGATASFSIGDASVIYADATLRRGRDRQTVLSFDASGTLQLDPFDSDTIRPFVTLGLGHTFANGLTVNAELSHDANGQNDTEWARTTAALQGLTPVTSAAGGAALGQLNGVLNEYTQRQNYGFVRLSKENLFGTDLIGEFTVLHGFDDNSGNVGLRIEYGVTDNARIGVQATQSYGGKNDEFTLRPDQSSLSLYTTVTF